MKFDMVRRLVLIGCTLLYWNGACADTVVLQKCTDDFSKGQSKVFVALGDGEAGILVINCATDRVVDRIPIRIVQ